jgi:hypothetical protein
VISNLKSNEIALDIGAIKNGGLTGEPSAFGGVVKVVMKDGYDADGSITAIETIPLKDGLNMPYDWRANIAL